MGKIRVIHEDQRQTEVASGVMTRVAGVSGVLTGAEGIHLALSTIPPAARASAHVHVNCESALYVLSGGGYLLTGEDLTETLRFGLGDFIYVPPDAPHEVVDDSLDTPLVFVVARNAPEEITEAYVVPGRVGTT